MSSLLGLRHFNKCRSFIIAMISTTYSLGQKNLEIFPITMTRQFYDNGVLKNSSISWEMRQGRIKSKTIIVTSVKKKVSQ